MLQRFADGELCALGEVRNLYHREGFQVNVGKALLEARHQIEKILERQIGMEPTDDVKFCYSLAIAGSSCLPGFLERHGVGTWRVFLPAKGAQTACRHTYVRRIDMAVNVKVGIVAVQSLTHVIG